MTSPRLPWLTVLLSVLALAVHAFFGPAADAFVYSAEQWQEQPWRWISAHWVHADTPHLAWNLLAFLLLGGLLEREGRGWLIAGLLVGALAVSASLAFLMPEIAFYCGLSGVLNTLWILALDRQWRRQTHAVLPLLALLSLLKIGYEMWSGAAVLTETAWPSLPQAHLAGWGVGVILVVLTRWVALCNTFRRVRYDLFDRAMGPAGKPVSCVLPTTNKD